MAYSQTKFNSGYPCLVSIYCRLVKDNLDGNEVSIYAYYFFLPIVCPNGITNITGSISTLVYPESGNYGVNETKCWRIKVPDISDYIIYRFSRYVSCVDALQ